MPGPGGRDRKPSEVNRSAVASDEELKRMLERDTAVQGEREEESTTLTRRPAAAERGSATARPASGPRRSKTK